jgi:hypothetical protein
MTYPHLKELHTKELMKALKQARSGSYSPFYPSGPHFSVDDIKVELATREHVPNKAEAKAIRQAKARG